MIRLDNRRAPLARFVEQIVGPRPGAPQPDLTAYAPDDVEAARLGWASRIVDEYRSVVVFSDVLHRLTDLSAPFAVLATMHGLVGDELRHTWLCAEVAGWLGGTGDLTIDLEGLGLPDAEAPPAARVLEVVAREIVVAEEESVAVLRAYRDACVDPTIRGVLETLLHDEVRHAAAGREVYAFLVDALPAADVAPLVAELPQIMATDRQRLRHAYACGARGGPGRALGVSLRAEDLA